QTRLPEHRIQLGELALAADEARQRDRQPTGPSSDRQERDRGAPGIQLLSMGDAGGHQPPNSGSPHNPTAARSHRPGEARMSAGRADPPAPSGKSPGGGMFGGLATATVDQRQPLKGERP